MTGAILAGGLDDGFGDDDGGWNLEMIAAILDDDWVCEDGHH